jgi:hypothetical protein
MDTAQTTFAEMERGGATGSDVTESDVTGSDVSHVTGRGPDRKWRNHTSRGRKRPWLEVTGSMFCSCPAFPALFPPYYGGSTSNMATGSAKGHVAPRGSLGCAHAHPEVVKCPPKWGLLTGSDVMKRHP